MDDQCGANDVVVAIDERLRFLSLGYRGSAQLDKQVEDVVREEAAGGACHAAREIGEADDGEIRYVGDFENPGHAAQLLIEHLKKVIDYVQRKGIESPACIGLIARTFEKIGYQSPTIKSDKGDKTDLEYHPAEMFESAFDGDWVDDGMFEELGFDKNLSKKMHLEAYPRSMIYPGMSSTSGSLDGSNGGLA